MKKLLSILTISTLTATNTTWLISCEKTKLDNNLLEDENNNDIETWNKIQQETVNDFLNLMKKENTVYEIDDSELYSKVSDKKEKEENIVLQGTEKNIINQIIQSNLKKINETIKKEYSNYFYDHDPIKIVEGTEKFDINYIDSKAYSIINKIDVDTLNKVKSISITYDLQIELTYKKIKKPFNNKFEFIFTTNKNFILNRISELVNYIKEKIYEFHNDNNNQKLLYDNNQFKKDSFNIFKESYSTKIVNDFITQKFIDFLKNKQKKDNKNFIFKIKNNFLISQNDDESYISSIFYKITTQKQKGYGYKSELELEQNLVSNWLFDKNKNLKNNENDFSNFYYDKNKIENEIKINSFAINLNAISIYGLPLINKILDNKINFYISKEWIEERIKEFGNLIYEFFKFFNTVLNDDKTITLKVNSELFNKIKNTKDKNKEYYIPNLLMNEFKKNKKMNEINDFDLVSNFYNDSNLISVDDKNNKIFFNNSSNKWSWWLGFKYGADSYYKDQFFYTPFGSKNVKANLIIEKNN